MGNTGPESTVPPAAAGVPGRRLRRPGGGAGQGRAATVWLPIVVWAAAIFALSSVPGLDSGFGVWDLLLRKAAHVTEYAVLGALLVRAMRELPAFVAGVAYAVTDELHQTVVAGRAGALLDVAVDAAGVLLGILVLRRLG
jgi:VanZ like family